MRNRRAAPLRYQAIPVWEDNEQPADDGRRWSTCRGFIMACPIARHREIRTLTRWYVLPSTADSRRRCWLVRTFLLLGPIASILGAAALIVAAGAAAAPPAIVAAAALMPIVLGGGIWGSSSSLTLAGCCAHPRWHRGPLEGPGGRLASRSPWAPSSLPARSCWRPSPSSRPCGGQRSRRGWTARSRPTASPATTVRSAATATLFSPRWPRRRRLRPPQRASLAARCGAATASARRRPLVGARTDVRGRLRQADETCEAPNADTMPATPTTAATRRSVLCFVRLRHVPMTAVGTMTANDVPLATTAGMPNSTIMAGTMTIPADAQQPARIPVTNPITTSVAARPTVSSERPRRWRDRRPDGRP